MAIRFDAAADRLSYSAVAPPSTFTITAWVYLSVDRNDFSTILRIYETGGTFVANLHTNSDGTGGPTLTTSAGDISNTTGFVVGEWRRVAITRTGSTGQTLVSTVGGGTEVDSSTSGTNTPGGITLAGRSVSDSTEWLNGRLALVRVWSTVLTQGQIEAEWASATPVITSNLWANWPLATATDLTDTANSRTLAVASGGSLTTEDGPPFEISGAVAGSLPALDGELAGTVTSSGAIAGSLPALDGELAGSVTASGALAGSLPAIDGELAGTVITPGAVAGSLPALDGELAGSVTADGVVAGSLPALDGELAGSVTVAGSLAGVLPALDGELAAAVVTAGAVAGALPALTGSLAGGSPAVTGVVSGQLPGVAGALTAAVTISGALSGSLPGLTGMLTTIPPEVDIRTGVVVDNVFRPLAGVATGDGVRGGAVVDNVLLVRAGIAS